MLEVSKINLKLKLTAPSVLSRWLGSAFRGGFGEHLRRASCPNREACTMCPTLDDCLFFYLYERESSRRGHAPPTRPVIIVPPFFGQRLALANGGTLSVDVLLFGRFVKYLPHVILGMKLFGFAGIGNLRRDKMNTFVIESATCAFSGKEIYDGHAINASNVTTVDVEEVGIVREDAAKISFRTPLILKSSDFPPAPEKLLELIRSRLILYVNEYGDQTTVAPFMGGGYAIACARHFHVLERRSRRAGASRFEGFTGIANYSFDEVDDVGRWLLRVGSLLGAGPKSAFGCGFFDVSPHTGAVSDVNEYLNSRRLSLSHDNELK